MGYTGECQCLIGMNLTSIDAASQYRYGIFTNAKRFLFVLICVYVVVTLSVDLFTECLYQIGDHDWFDPFHALDMQ